MGGLGGCLAKPLIQHSFEALEQRPQARAALGSLTQALQGIVYAWAPLLARGPAGVVSIEVHGSGDLGEPAKWRAGD